MRLEQTNYDNSETGCCARLDTKLWDGRELVWNDKPFLKDHIRSFLHIPLNYGSVIGRDQAVVEEQAAWPEEPFWLTDEVSPWGADLYLALAPGKEFSGVTIERLSGRFLTRVFEGPYRFAGKWAKEMEDHVTSRGLTPEKFYFYYATCPKCVKRFGKNHVVLFAKVR